ncbi:MAG TPA: hypothetical protein VF337_08075 [Candidatus Limnocylindrales bacterium]
MSFHRRPGESDVAAAADSVAPAVLQAWSNQARSDKRAEAPEDDWKIPTGPLDDLEPGSEREPAHAGGLLKRLTHRG